MSDDLHDEFGDQLTEALGLRSPGVASPLTATSVQRHARRRQTRRRVMTGTFTVALLAVAAYGLVDRSNNGTRIHTINPSASTTAEPPTDPIADGLRSAATAYAQAFLTGSYDDVIPLLDPACRPDRMSKPELDLARRQWTGFQDALSKTAGVDLADIEIIRVDVRRGDGLASEAQVVFALPAAIAGNDNWIRYALGAEGWHLSGCLFTVPIGGSKSPMTDSRAHNLPMTEAVRANLVAAFAAARDLDARFVAGTVPGSVYYGYDPGTGAYWALADFSASNAARVEHERLQGTPNDPYVAFQDGPMVLSQTTGTAWRLVTDTGGLVCTPPVPAPLLALWGVGGGGACP
jgi:hypothetical protein